MTDISASKGTRDILPLSLPPRGLSRAEASRYLGIGTTLFDDLVTEGSLPKPKKLRGRTVWDRRALDEAFDAWPSEDAESVWTKPRA